MKLEVQVSASGRICIWDGAPKPRDLSVSAEECLNCTVYGLELQQRQAGLSWVIREPCCLLTTIMPTQFYRRDSFTGKLKPAPKPSHWILHEERQKARREARAEQQRRRQELFKKGPIDLWIASLSPTPYKWNSRMLLTPDQVRCIFTIERIVVSITLSLWCLYPDLDLLAPVVMLALSR